MSDEPGTGGAQPPSPLLVFVRSIAFGALAGAASGPLSLLAWLAIDADARGGHFLLTFLLSFIPGVGVGLLLGILYGFFVAAWTLIRPPQLNQVRLVLTALSIVIDAVFVWRYDLEPFLAVVALPLALISVWVGTRLVLRAPSWVDDFAAKP